MGGIMTDNWKRIIADKDAETAEACEEEAAKQEKSQQQQELSALFLAAEVSGKELAEAIGVPWQPGSVDECGHVVGRDERHFPRILEELMRRLRAIISYLKANGWDALLDKVRESYAQRVLLVIRDGATSKEIRPLIDKRYLHWSMLEDVSADLRALIWPAPEPAEPASPIRKGKPGAMLDGAEQPAEPATPSEPKDYVFGWAEITAALKQINDEAQHKRIRNLHASFPGPIIFGKQGTPPKVDRSKLIDWWNVLEDQWQKSERRQKDIEATVEDSHPYGRTGTVVPDIGGHERKKREPSA
jgi:hypothetical protein